MTVKYFSESSASSTFVVSRSADKLTLPDCTDDVTVAYDEKLWLAYIMDRNEDLDEVKVTFHPCGPSPSFSFPRKPDVLWVSITDILHIVRPDTPTGRSYVLNGKFHVTSIIMSDQENEDCCSEASSVLNNGSVVSTVPDRHGFLGGSQYSPEPKRLSSPAVILKRERKWLQMLENWEKFMSQNYKKVRERCRKGIPPSVRQRGWLYLCGAKILMDEHPRLYQDLCSQEGDPRWVDDIRKDLHRQFPYHEMFVDQEGHGQRDLYNVLKAYSILNANVGYCQAQAPLAAFLLTRMPAQEAFWCLVSVCDNYLAGYYSQGMETLQIDGDILFGLLKKVAPHVHKHLKKQKIEPILYMTEWFLCVFTRTLPWATILRVWDMFLCEGVKILFKVALVLLKLSLNAKSLPSLKKKCPTMYETLEALRNPPLHILEEDFMVREMFRLKLTDEDFENEHHRQTSRHRANKQNSAASR